MRISRDQRRYVSGLGEDHKELVLRVTSRLSLRRRWIYRDLRECPNSADKLEHLRLSQPASKLISTQHLLKLIQQSWGGHDLPARLDRGG